MYNTKMRIKHLSFPTQDDIGGIVQTKYTETFANCRIRELAVVETTITGRTGVYSTHRIYCNPNTIIAPKDEVVINKVTYDVNVTQDIHGLGKLFQVDVTERS